MAENKTQQDLVRQERAGAEMAQDRPVFAPATDIIEREDAVEVVCDMPGVEQDRVDVTLENDVLTIIGTQQHDDPEGYQLLYRGYSDGLFRRVFTLSADIDRARIQARMKQGVLRITLPKAAEVQPRRIRIQAGE